MTDDLIQFTSAIAAQLPQTEADETFVFREETLSPLPAQLTTSDLVIKKHKHVYNGSYSRDLLNFSASKKAYEALGISIIGILLNQQTDQVDLQLNHPETDISLIRIQSYIIDLAQEYIFGLKLKPFAFAYIPEDSVSAKPWLHEAIPDVNDYPHFELTANDGCPVTPDQWATRDTVNGFGSPQGAARFAQLLLDISRPASATLEIMLEGEGGFRGVAPLSAEVRLWLPGGAGFTPADAARAHYSVSGPGSG